MKKFLILTILVLAGSLSAFSQSNEFYAGYSFSAEDVRVVRTVRPINVNFDQHGVVGSYTRYVKDNFLGVTGEVAGTFKSNRSNTLSAMGGLTLKSRGNKYVEPFLKGLVGVSRVEVPLSFVSDNSKVAFAYSVGGGLDFKTSHKVKIRVGADLVNTEFADKRHNGVRLHTGLVF